MSSPAKTEVREKVELKQLMKKFSCSLSFGRCITGAIPAGHMAVYVGLDRTRFVIPTRFINYPVFVSLLEDSEKELGYQPEGGLTFMCEVEVFDWIVSSLLKDENRFKGMALDQFLNLFAQEVACDCYDSGLL